MTSVLALRPLASSPRLCRQVAASQRPRAAVLCRTNLRKNFGYASMESMEEAEWTDDDLEFLSHPQTPAAELATPPLTVRSLPPAHQLHGYPSMESMEVEGWNTSVDEGFEVVNLQAAGMADVPPVVVMRNLPPPHRSGGFPSMESWEEAPYSWDTDLEEAQ